MNITLLGLGEVGFFLSQELIKNKHNLTIFEIDSIAFEKAKDSLDAKVLNNDGCLAKNLVQSNIEKCDLFLALSSDDTTNIIACSLARKLGAKKVICRIHQKTEQDKLYLNYQEHFNIDLFLDPEYLCAVKIAKQIYNFDFFTLNQALESISTELLKIHKNSHWCDKCIQELKISEKLKIAYLISDNEVKIPKEDTKLKENDIVAIIGTATDLNTLKSDSSFVYTYKNLNIVIYGATELSLNLIELLKKPFYKIRLIEKNEKLCQDFAVRFPEITVIQDDATSLTLLLEEQVSEVDVFISCTKDDENNIMSALQSIKLGAKKAEVLISSTNYELLVEDFRDKLDPEAIHSPRVYTFNAIKSYTQNKAYVELATLQDTQTKIIELEVNSHSYYLNKAIKDLKIPEESSILAIVKNFQHSVVQSDYLIQEKDKLIFIIKDFSLKKLKT